MAVQSRPELVPGLLRGVVGSWTAVRTQDIELIARAQEEECRAMVLDTVQIEQLPLGCLRPSLVVDFWDDPGHRCIAHRPVIKVRPSSVTSSRRGATVKRAKVDIVPDTAAVIATRPLNRLRGTGTPSIAAPALYIIRTKDDDMSREAMSAVKGPYRPHKPGPDPPVRKADTAGRIIRPNIQPESNSVGPSNTV